MREAVVLDEEERIAQMRMYFDKKKALPVILAGLNLGVFRYRLTRVHISVELGRPCGYQLTSFSLLS